MNLPPNPRIDDYIAAYRAYQREQAAAPAPVVARGDAMPPFAVAYWERLIEVNGPAPASSFAPDVTTPAQIAAMIAYASRHDVGWCAACQRTHAAGECNEAKQ